VRIAPFLAGRAWLLVPALALAFVAATSAARIRHVRYVSGLADFSVGETAGGPAGAQPGMIVPGNSASSLEWLDQTRQMLSGGDLRVRRVGYENAPFGHDVRAASPYRWWLGSLAWICHLLSGRPLVPSLETASLFADPLLYAVMLAGVTLFAARRFGAPAAAVLSAGVATLYPFAVGFIPGAPDDKGLVLCVGIWSVLPLLAGVASAQGRSFWFGAAGVAGGIGLWLGVPNQVALIAGVGIGGLAADWIARGSPAAVAGGPLPWRTWAACGAVTSLAAYILEYFPSHMGSWDLRAVHPLYGVAWLGWGQALALASALIRKERAGWGARQVGLALLAALGLTSLPVAMGVGHTLGFLATDLSSYKLARLPNAAAALNLPDWIVSDGFSPVVLSALLPVLLMVPAIWLLARRSTPMAARMSIALALGPATVALGFAGFELSWWNAVDASLVAVVAAVTRVLWTAGSPRIARWAWVGLAVVALAPGAFQAVPRDEAGGKNALVETEVVGLIERDLSRWLALHAPPGDGVVLAPANATTALYYYGGLRGLGTLDWENQDGVQAAVRIASATSTDEALDLINRRGVAYIIIPSWDPQLDGFARMGLGQLEGSFIYRLHRWVLPPWLRPVSFPLPVIGGFEGQSVTIFQVTDEQSDALLMSRIAEYFIDEGNLEMAAAAGNALRRFQVDISALVARAQVEMAQGNADAFSRSVESLLPRLSGEGERALPLDRRVSLAVVLAQGHHLDRAREEVQRCMAELDEERLKSLTTDSLYHLQVLGRVVGMEIPDPRMRQLALDLLPPDVRSKLNR
jgi:hypothetical protein